LTGAERTQYVRGLFNTIAGPYDRMNTIISLGQAQNWRRTALRWAGVQPGSRAVDLGTGTGDLFLLLTELVGPRGSVTGIDLAENMLEIARAKALQKNPTGNHDLRLGSADATGLPDDSVDLVTMGWVLRNIGDRPAAYREVLRILKPGGKFLCIEMSQPDSLPLRWGSQFYLNWIMPVFVRLARADYAAYRYLVASTGRFPGKSALVLEWRQAGFTEIRYRSLLLGQVALHLGEKPNE